MPLQNDGAYVGSRELGAKVALASHAMRRQMDMCYLNLLLGFRSYTLPVRGKVIPRQENRSVLLN